MTHLRLHEPAHRGRGVAAHRAARIEKGQDPDLDGLGLAGDKHGIASAIASQVLPLHGG
jgi:hypothetical protein